MFLRYETEDLILTIGNESFADKIKEYLIKNDYVYSEEQRQFRPVGYDS